MERAAIAHLLGDVGIVTPPNSQKNTLAVNRRAYFFVLPS